MRIATHQRHDRLAAEINVSLVDDNNRISVGFEQALDLRNAKSKPGRRIRIGENDAAVFPHIVADIDFETRVERDLLVTCPEQPAVHRVKAVSDVRKQDRRRVREQGPECMRKHFVRTIAGA